MQMASDREQLEAVAILAEQPGFRYVEDWATRELRAKRRRLEEIDLSNPIAGAVLQGEIRGLEAMVKHIRHASERWARMVADEEE